MKHWLPLVPGLLMLGFMFWLMWDRHRMMKNLFANIRKRKITYAVDAEGFLRPQPSCVCSFITMKVLDGKCPIHPEGQK